MNVNQLGQKKKKQAVRRLSHSSPATQGNRKEDIRRKLEAKRHADSQAHGRQKLQRGNSRHGRNFEKKLGSSSLGPSINRNPRSSETGVRKYVSPLVNANSIDTLVSTSNKVLHTTSSSTSRLGTVISKNPVQETSKQDNVFKSSLFNANAQHDNVFGKSKFDTSARTQENISVISEFHQQPRNIFGAFSSIKTGDKHKSIPETSLSGFDGTISKSSDMPEIQPHQSPLTASAMGHTLTNLPSNIFGSTPRESSQFGTSGKQENIFMSSQSENPPANIFGGVSTLERTFPIVSQTSSTLAVVFCKSNNAPNTNTKAHQSPLTSLMVATGNSNNSLAITAAGIKKEVTQVNSEGNNSGKVAATSFGQAVTSSLSSTFPVKSKPGSAGQGNGFAPAGTYQMIFYRPSSTEKTDYEIHKGPSQSSSFTSSTQTSILGNAGVTHSTSLFSGSNNSTRNVSMNFSAENSANSLGDLTTQGNVFGIAELPPSSTKLSNSSSISNLSKDSNAISGDTPNTGFDGSTLTNQQSIFGSAGLPPTSTLFSSQNLFSVQSTGTFFSNKNKASPSTLSNIDSSMAAKWTPLTQTSLSNATGTPSSASLGNKDQSFGFVNVFGSQQMPSNSFSSNSQRRTVECSQEIETGKILSKERASPKGLKRRTSTSMDVSDLTAIVIKGLTKDYFKKELLTKCFSAYGKIKVSLQPAKEIAVITFDSHESAKKAKFKAPELFPLKDLGVYWCKKRRSGSGSGTIFSKTPDRTGREVLSEVNKRELSLRKLSISGALRSIDVNAFPPALNAKERFTVLDEIDKRIRQAIKPYTDLATAPAIVGVCPDMCPEKERYMREDRVNLSVFEMLPGTQENRDGDVPRVDHTKAVKEYSRSAADKLEPLAHEMRPVHVLQMTMDYLAANVMDNGEGRWGEWFNFLWDRTRAIRKDITQQHLCSLECVDLVEKITRFHIFCAHYLCEEDMHCFDPKINNENLTKCLQTLKQFYLDFHSDKNTVCPQEPEFQAYDILLNLNEGDTLRKAMQYRIEVRNSSEVKFALEVFSSLNSNNYVRFFKLLKSASYLNACIMHRYFTQVRSRALRTMTRAYRSQESYPLQELLDLLAFEDKEEATRFCAHYNFTTSNDSVQFSKSSFVEPETVIPLQKAKKMIEIKRNCSIGEVVNGSPLKALAHHEPLCSFDTNGRYVGLASLVQLLGGTPDAIEPESPDYFYEPAVSVPAFEQQSVEQAQSSKPAYDLQQILTQEIQNTCFVILEEAVHGLVKDVCDDAICEVKLKLELSKMSVDKFLSESLLVLVREIANQCIEEEIKVKREKIAAAQSRDRVSAAVLEEITDDVLRSELIIVAENSRREIQRMLKAQSFVRMSAVIMREISEDIVSEQCRDIAFKSHKEAVNLKKATLWKLATKIFNNQKRRCFDRWCEEYHARVHIRNILHQMPAKPPMLSSKQQLQKLFKEKDISDSSGSRLSLSQVFHSSLTERAQLQHDLKEKVKECELKRIRAKEPIDIPRILSEISANSSGSPSTRDPNKTKLMKLVVSLPNDVQVDSPGTVEKLIKCKFSRGAVAKSSTVPTALEKKVETLSCYASAMRQISRGAREFKVDIKVLSGVLSNEESSLLQISPLFLGLTGVVFLLNSSGQDKDEMFWTKARTRLRQILKCKPPVPSIPVVILDIKSLTSDDENIIDKQLNVGSLREEGLISHWMVYQLERSVDSDDLHKQLEEVIRWLTYHYPSTPIIKCENLKRLVENEVLKHFTIPLYEEIALRKRSMLQPQCPEVIIKLYNTVIEHITSVITNAKLKNISWPIPEFVTASTEDFPPVSWNSSETLQRLHNVLRKLGLPPPPSPASDGKWKSERKLCLDYVNVLVSGEPLKKFGFSLVDSVERILNQSGVEQNNHMLSSLTAADVPWPQVVETCVSTLLSWLHNLPDSAAGNVYYIEEDLRSFTEPALWRAAVTESLKMAEGAVVMREKSKSSHEFRNLTKKIEQELRRVNSTSPYVHHSKSQAFAEDIEEKTRLLERKLGVEKLSCQRFEEQLKTLLDEGVDVDRLEFGQGVKRKCNPSWLSTSKSGKAFYKKVTMQADAVPLPDLRSTLNHFETSLVTFQNQVDLQRHVEEYTERKLVEALDDNP